MYSEDEEEELSLSLEDYYGKDLSALLKNSFESKTYHFDTRGARLPSSADLLFAEEKWNVSTYVVFLIIFLDMFPYFQRPIQHVAKRVVARWLYFFFFKNRIK